MSEDKHDKVEKLVEDLIFTFEAWLIKYPLQVLLITEKICFSTLLKESFVGENKDFSFLRL